MIHSEIAFCDIFFLSQFRNGVPLSKPIVPVHEVRSIDGGTIPRIRGKDQSHYDRLLAQKLEHNYEMDNKSRGIALIFNHEKFADPGLGKRTGTAVDSFNLKQTFGSLNFDVQIHNDLSLKEIKRTLEECKLLFFKYVRSQTG